MDANEILNVSPAQFRRAAEIKERIDELSRELETILGGARAEAPQSNTGTATRGRRRMSSEGRARIAAAARARWARQRGEKSGKLSGTEATGPKKKRTMSAAARAKIAAAQRARWAKAKAGKS